MGVSPPADAGIGDSRSLSLDVLPIMLYFVLDLEFWVHCRNGILSGLLHGHRLVDVKDGLNRESPAQAGRQRFRSALR